MLGKGLTVSGGEDEKLRISRLARPGRMIRHFSGTKEEKVLDELSYWNVWKTRYNEIESGRAQ